MGLFSVISVFSVVHTNDADIEMPQAFGSYLLPPQNFHQRDGAGESRVAGLVDHSHPAFAELLQDLVLQDSPADHGLPKTLARDNTDFRISVIRGRFFYSV